jgi:hypothetical protein
LVGEPELVNDSSPKNRDHLLGLDGLEGVAANLSASAASTSAGIEFRRRGDTFRLSVAFVPKVPSRIAPAVLGLDSARSRVGLLERAGLSRPAGCGAETSEDRLPETE